MENIHIYRKRYIPKETVELKNDDIIFFNHEILVTRWKVLKPRHDFSHGLSVYYIDKGFKISKIYNEKNELVYWYCDIIHTEFKPEDQSYIFHDLFIDILEYPDGSHRVLDLDEFADALDQNLLPTDIMSAAIRQTNYLMQAIQQNSFDVLKKPIQDFESMGYVSL